MTQADSITPRAFRNFFRHLSAIARDQWAASGDWSSHDNKDLSGFDPVTGLDHAIEHILRKSILDRYPGDGVWGEEAGWSNPGAARVWSLDPVDGTRALICNLPSWAVLVGVIEDGRHVAGMIDLPVLGEHLVASGEASFLNEAPVRTSGCSSLGRARLTTTDPGLFEGPEAAGFERVRSAALVTRYGLDALGFARVATGGLDLVVESRLGRHDLDAVVAVVRGAGGHVGDWLGGEDWDGGRIVAAASRALYDEAVALLTD